jgi:acyl-coenzyme A thioesterase PaaI-like protein
MPVPQPSSRSCFVCGRENPAGLRARFTADHAASEVRAELAIPEEFNGYPGVAHGGIVSALLDEAAVRTALIGGEFEDLMVTAKIEIVFRCPTPTGTPITVVGRLLRRSGARAQAEAEVRLADGTVTSRATVLLARSPPEVARAWAAERPYWRVDDR